MEKVLIINSFSNKIDFLRKELVIIARFNHK